MTAVDRYFQTARDTLAEVAATQGEALDDDPCPPGDAAVALAGGERVGSATTVVGAAVLAALAARVAELLHERGATPPVVVSQNLDGRGAAERNQQLLRAYRGRTRLPL